MAQNRPAAHMAAQKEGKARDLGICQLCGSPLDPEGHHIIEYHFGGAPDPNNIVTLCHRCHRLVHSGAVDIIRG